MTPNELLTTEEGRKKFNEIKSEVCGGCEHPRSDHYSARGLGNGGWDYDKSVEEAGNGKCWKCQANEYEMRKSKNWDNSFVEIMGNDKPSKCDGMDSFNSLILKIRKRRGNGKLDSGEV